MKRVYSRILNGEYVRHSKYFDGTSQVHVRYAFLAQALDSLCEQFKESHHMITKNAH